MLSASTTHRRGRRFTSGEPKYIFTEHLQDGEREQPILPGCRRDPMRTRESVWRQSFPPFPQIQLHIPCPPSSIFVPRSWAAQGRWGPDAVSGSIIRAEGDLVSMIYSCGRLHVPCHSTQLQSDVSTFTGWIWNSAYYWRWIINLCLILLISVVKVPTNFLLNFFLETKRGLISQLSQSNRLQLDVMEITGLFFPGSRARDFACFVVIARKNRKKIAKQNLQNKPRSVT